MWVRRHEPTLDSCYAAGRCPELMELEGVFAVKMLTGLLPDFSRFQHRKIICNGRGSNVFWDKAEWGYFSVSYNHLDGGRESVLLDYDQRENPLYFRRIRDCVKAITNGYFLGTFNYLVGSRLVFVGYFLLCRVRRL